MPPRRQVQPNEHDFLVPAGYNTKREVERERERTRSALSLSRMQQWLITLESWAKCRIHLPNNTKKDRLYVYMTVSQRFVEERGRRVLPEARFLMDEVFCLPALMVLMSLDTGHRQDVICVYLPLLPLLSLLVSSNLRQLFSTLTISLDYVLHLERKKSHISLLPF